MWIGWFVLLLDLSLTPLLKEAFAVQVQVLKGELRYF